MWTTVASTLGIVGLVAGLALCGLHEPPLFGSARATALAVLSAACLAGASLLALTGAANWRWSAISAPGAGAIALIQWIARQLPGGPPADALDEVDALDEDATAEAVEEARAEQARARQHRRVDELRARSGRV